VSCPDWRDLVAARDAAPGIDPPGWAAARSHAAQCERCRTQALAADPLLLFARLPERAVSAVEIADMQASVAALVRASRVAQHPATPLMPSALSSSPADARGERSLGNAAPGLLSATRVAAALGICSLLALSGVPRSPSRAPGSLAESASVPGASAPGSAVEELDRPGARIYELPQSDMSVVMIVDASLDV
jgi:hypothetical protein